MINLKNILNHIWSTVKSYAGQVYQFVVNPSEAASIWSSKAKATECLRRTRGAYYALTYYPIKDLVTAHSLDNLVRNSHSFSELCKNVENSGARGDELYCYLLIFAIAEVYKSPTTPQLNGTFSVKLLK